MKTSLRLTCLALALASVVCVSGPANAQMGNGYGMMGGGGWGAGGYALSPEKQAAAQKIHSQHENATAQLRQQLFVKHAELDALLYGGSADERKIQSLTKEITDLSAKLFTDHVKLRQELIKAGVPVGGMGHGMGYGGMGYGGGMMNGYGGGMGYHGGMMDSD
ncbi:MAG: periplasmic heavy metal sensor [Humidesulfovibrio sp.]|nr:periplasmic heavy metal sensor [Humidesulfovibrio sp.]